MICNSYHWADGSIVITQLVLVSVGAYQFFLVSQVLHGPFSFRLCNIRKTGFCTALLGMHIYKKFSSAWLLLTVAVKWQIFDFILKVIAMAVETMEVLIWSILLILGHTLVVTRMDTCHLDWRKHQAAMMWGFSVTISVHNMHLIFLLIWC